MTTKREKKEMPETCYDCEYCRTGKWLMYRCELLNEEFEFIQDKRRDGCPLKFLLETEEAEEARPAKMRLIDATKFIEYAEANLDMQDLYLPTHIEEFVIDEMPTIEAIPIEWLESWSDNDDITSHAFSWADVGFQVIQNVIEDWRKENE